ncbi:MAG: restriction endonuclease [Candidatus Altiarchaeota archaeon]
MMKEPSESGSDFMKGGFKEYVLDIIPALKLSVSSVEVEGEHIVKVKAENPSLSKTTLIEALHQKRKVGQHTLIHFMDEMGRQNVKEGVFISTAGFTDDALEYAKEKGITAYTTEDIKKLKAPKERGHNIFEKAYRGSMSIDQAREDFGRRAKRALFGFFGVNERVESVEGRYAPVGCFKLRKSIVYPRLGKPRRSQGGENTFYVNLASCELYRIYRGVGGRNPKVKSTNILRRMMDLDDDAVRIMSETIEQEEVIPDESDAEYRSFLQRNINNLILLQNRGLITIRGDGKGYALNVNIPKFKDERYDLSRFLEAETSTESDFHADDVEYQPNHVLKLMEAAFKSEGEFKGVTYIPYFWCKYAGSDDSIRFDVIIDVTFKNG